MEGQPVTRLNLFIGSTPDALREAEEAALRDLVHRFPTLGIQLESALRAAYRRALFDAGVIPRDSPLLNTSQRALP
ncbi:hypothetical protein K9B35_14455 [Sphingomonas sp. R647]|uniref:hypothetical protein n=1 Tax=Sphingomonas sp. R647 TaxID=2875233 RepID=UPI001CD36DC3|nr:hypothetical protein [Sphingomonas sp. R647]MCA1199176.1 hypothetical protein [Sphingomonas sp. R647]